MNAKHLSKFSILKKFTLFGVIIAVVIITAFSICITDYAGAQINGDQNISITDTQNENASVTTKIGDTGFALTGEREAQINEDYDINTDDNVIDIYTDGWTLEGENMTYYIELYVNDITFGNLKCYGIDFYESISNSEVAIKTIDESVIICDYIMFILNCAISISGNSTITIQNGLDVVSSVTDFVIDGPNFLFKNTFNRWNGGVFNFDNNKTYFESGSIRCEVPSDSFQSDTCILCAGSIEIDNKFDIFLSHYENPAFCYNNLDCEDSFLGSTNFVSYDKRDTLTDTLNELDEEHSYGSSTSKILAVGNTGAKTVSHLGSSLLGVNVSGHVADEDNPWQPVPGAFVQYCRWTPWGSVPVPEMNTFTDWSGNFTLEGIEEDMLPGVIRVYRFGYEVGESAPIWFVPEGIDTIYRFVEMAPSEPPVPPVPPTPPDPPVPPVPPQPDPPQPVPPTPVPPTPVDPGTNIPQTGDSAAIALAIAGLLALCGACAFAACAKRRFSTWF